MRYLQFYSFGIFNLFYMYIIFNFSWYTFLTVAMSPEANHPNSILGPKSVLYLILFLIVLSSVIIYWSFKYKLPAYIKLISYLSFFIFLWACIAASLGISLANELFLFPFIGF